MVKGVLIKSVAGASICAALLIAYFFFIYPTAEAIAEPPISLPVAIARRADVTTFKSYPVAIEGEMDVEIRPQVEGYLTATAVVEGDYVAKGATLFRIDEQLYREQYNEARANVEVSQAKLDRATIELNRSKTLLASHIISEVELRTVEADYRAVKGLLLQAEAMKERARIRLEYTHITAPVSGLVGRLPYRMGSFITTANVEPLTLLSAVDKVRARFSIGEQDYRAFKENYTDDSAQVSLLLSDGQPYPYKGVIDAVNGMFDKNTGAITVWVKFPNPGRTIRSGNTGSVQIKQRHSGILLIPEVSTFRQQDKVVVYRLNEQDLVETRVVTITEKWNGQFVVVGGLVEGDRVLASGMNKVAEGMRITPSALSPLSPRAK